MSEIYEVPENSVGNTVPPAMFVDVGKIPWSSFPGFEDTMKFKLLRLDEETLGTTILLRYRTGVPKHKHFGAVEVFTLTGCWWYEGEGSARAGDYTYEFGGGSHTAVTENDEWMDALVISRGPLQVYLEDGSLGPVVDGFAYYDAAAANNAVGHLPVPFGRQG